MFSEWKQLYWKQMLQFKSCDNKTMIYFKKIRRSNAKMIDWKCSCQITSSTDPWTVQKAQQVKCKFVSIFSKCTAYKCSIQNNPLCLLFTGYEVESLILPYIFQTTSAAPTKSMVTLRQIWSQHKQLNRETKEKYYSKKINPSQTLLMF